MPSNKFAIISSALVISGPWPAVRLNLIGRPCLSISAWILVVRPPRGRPKQRSRPPFCYRNLLVNVNNRAVDHLDIALMGLINRVHHAIPDHYLSPSGVAVVDRYRRTIALGEIRLGNTSAQPPENAVEHQEHQREACSATCWEKAEGSHTNQKRSVHNEPSESPLLGASIMSGQYEETPSARL